MVDIMAVGAHPDDIEFGCGGVLCKLAAQKKSMVLVDLTFGDKGTNGTPEIRKREAEEAAQLLGAERVFLGFKDCEIADNYENRLELVKVIRQYRPRLILGPMWKGEQNHPDHIATGQLLRAACRYARFGKILPEILPYRPEGILHVPNLTMEPDFIVDVSDYVEDWKRLMGCHKSQHKTLPFTDLVLRRASYLGLLIGKAYGEGFVKGNPIEIDDLMAISRSAREL